MTNRFKAALTAGILTVLCAGPALAHGGSDDRSSSSSFKVTRTEALDIASAEGIVEVWEVKARRGVWKVEGADANGDKLEVEIDGDTGEIVKVETYRSSGSTR